MPMRKIIKSNLLGKQTQLSTTLLFKALTYKRTLKIKSIVDYN